MQKDDTIHREIIATKSNRLASKTLQLLCMAVHYGITAGAQYLHTL